MADPDAYRRAARVLEDLVAARGRLVVAAQDGWRGRHRNAFDDDDAQLCQRARELAERLLGAAMSVEAERSCAPR